MIVFLLSCFFYSACRESVAIFLTRGDLWQSWAEGKKVFEELLLDYEPGVSSGCWMKSSCSAFITGPVEHYCPISFGKKLDPHGEYIRRYIPELQHYPGIIIIMHMLQVNQLYTSCVYVTVMGIWLES